MIYMPLRSGMQVFDLKCVCRAAADHSVFVGDLAPDVTDYVLQEHFRQYFPTVRSAKVSIFSLKHLSAQTSSQKLCV